MCGYKDKFVEFNQKLRGNVSFRDSLKIQIEGKSTIMFFSRIMELKKV